jgi:hypothetical protein
MPSTQDIAHIERLSKDLVRLAEKHKNLLSGSGFLSPLKKFFNTALTVIKNPSVMNLVKKCVAGILKGGAAFQENATVEQKQEALEKLLKIANKHSKSIDTNNEPLTAGFMNVLIGMITTAIQSFGATVSPILVKSAMRCIKSVLSAGSCVCEPITTSGGQKKKKESEWLVFTRTLKTDNIPKMYKTQMYVRKNGKITKI